MSLGYVMATVWRLPLRLCLSGQLLMAIAVCLPLSAELVAVTRVVDGNSFEADGDRKRFIVHLVGVEVPRLSTTAENELAAVAATEFLACLINRKAVDIESVAVPRGDRAIYAYVLLGELSVNEAVLQNGFGEVSHDYSAAPLDRFREIERVANREGNGVWNPLGPPKEISCDPKPLPPDTSPVSAPTQRPDSEGDSPSVRARTRAERMLRRFDEKRWTVLFSTGEGIFGYDAKLTEREGRGRYLTWLRLDYVEAQRLGDAEYHYSLERVRINCSKHLVQTLSTVKYNHQSDDTTKVVFSWTPAPVDEKWEPIVPESFGEQLYGELCKVLTVRYESTAAKKKGASGLGVGRRWKRRIEIELAEVKQNCLTESRSAAESARTLLDSLDVRVDGLAHCVRDIRAGRVDHAGPVFPDHLSHFTDGLQPAPQGAV